MYNSKLFEVEVNHAEVFLCVVVDILVFWPFRLIKRGVLGVLKYHEVSKELQKQAENVNLGNIRWPDIDQNFIVEKYEVSAFERTIKHPCSIYWSKNIFRQVTVNYSLIYLYSELGYNLL